MADRDGTGGYQLGGCTGRGFLPGQSGNPQGRPKRRSFGELSAAIDGERASAFAWSKREAEQLGFDPAEVTIGELLVHGAKAQAMSGKAGFLSEDNNRREGKVPDRMTVEGEVKAAINIAMFPAEPPENWYKDVRKLIGHRPGDPLLPGETTGGERGIKL